MSVYRFLNHETVKTTQSYQQMAVLRSTTKKLLHGEKNVAQNGKRLISFSHFPFVSSHREESGKTLSHNSSLMKPHYASTEPNLDRGSISITSIAKWGKREYSFIRHTAEKKSTTKTTNFPAHKHQRTEPVG